MTFLNGVPLDAEQQLKLIDEYGGIEALGGIQTAPHYAAAWAHAGNVPFQWGKQMASHLGGTRNPMNRRVAEPDHATRLAYAIYALHRRGSDHPEAAGIPEPKIVDGITQEPMDGTSFLYTFATSTPTNVTLSSTSRSSAAGPFTKTAGGRARDLTRPRGTYRLKR